jgi:hypothetical protein
VATSDPLAPGSITSVRARAAAIRLHRDDLLLFIVCLVAAVPMLYLAANQFVEYDGFWHVFIAQQDNFRAFWWEYMHNDHPLLFYLALKVVVSFGHSVLLYRAIPVASGLGAVFVLGKIARKLSSSPFTPPLTALAFGLSMPAIEIAISVRSYMFSIFFVLLSFYYFLDLLPRPGQAVTRRTRVLFALSTILALCSHYFSFFYVAASALLLLGFCLARSPLPRKTWIAHGLTFLPVVFVMWCLYHFHIRYNADNLNHVPDYLWVAPEPKIKFLLRSLHSLFNFLSPWHIASRGVFEKVAVALAAVVIGATAFARSRALAPAFMLLILLSELAVAGCLDRYPFGGMMRQQFILFPFVMLTAGVCLDQLFGALRAPRLVWTMAGLLCLAVIATSISRFNAFPKRQEELFTREMRLFDAALPSPSAVYVDQFNLIGFFTHRHEWTWHFVGRLPMTTEVEEYSLTRGNRRMELLRDKLRWNIDFSDPTFFRDIAESLRAARLGSLAVFCVHQGPAAVTPDQQDAFQQKTFALAEAQHLRIRKFVPDGLNVYAEFAPAGQADAASR